MDRKTKLKILKAANLLVSELLDCGDAEFCDMVLAAVMEARIFDEDEMFEIVMGADDE